MQGLSQLHAMRMAGCKPVHVVVYAGDGRVRGPWQSAFEFGAYCYLADSENIHLLDLRPFLGCEVIVSMPLFDTRMATLFDLLTHYANYIICLPQHEPDRGFKWLRNRGAVWMTEFWQEVAA